MASILVIDDDLEIRRMIVQMLRRSEYEVMDAGDGNEALRLQHESPADLVITDIIMPEKEGIETIMELRREFPNIKIIAISGGGRIGPIDYLNTAKKFGALRAFTKPFDWAEMLHAVRELLGEPSKDV
jgi:DNA-binding NtrC family response regulator